MYGGHRRYLPPSRRLPPFVVTSRTAEPAQSTTAQVGALRTATRNGSATSSRRGTDQGSPGWSNPFGPAGRPPGRSGDGARCRCSARPRRGLARPGAVGCRHPRPGCDVPGCWANERTACPKLPRDCWFVANADRLLPTHACCAGWAAPATDADSPIPPIMTAAADRQLERVLRPHDGSLLFRGRCEWHVAPWVCGRDQTPCWPPSRQDRWLTTHHGPARLASPSPRGSPSC